MLFEKSKENLEIITWYHKSFSSAPRLSELGRGEVAGRPGAGKVMLCSPVLLSYLVVRRVRVADVLALSLPVVG